MTGLLEVWVEIVERAERVVKKVWLEDDELAKHTFYIRNCSRELVDARLAMHGYREGYLEG